MHVIITFHVVISASEIFICQYPHPHLPTPTPTDTATATATSTATSTPTPSLHPHRATHTATHLSFLACESDLAAKEMGQPLADVQPQPRPPEPTRHRAVS